MKKTKQKIKNTIFLAKYFNKFGEKIGIKINFYSGWSSSVDLFIERLNKNVFENKYKLNSINWEYCTLQSFIRFMFHNNFNGYSQYYKFILPFINKRRYEKI